MSKGKKHRTIAHHQRNLPGYTPPATPKSKAKGGYPHRQEFCRLK
jgi:hypothetical protein